MWLRVFIVNLLLTSLCTSMSANAASLILVTEENPPFQFTDTNDVGESYLTGLCVEIVEALMAKSKIDYEFRVYPWKRAFQSARTLENYGVFSTVKTPERKDMFKWVGPIFRSEWIVMAKKDQAISINSIEDLRNYSLGGYSGDARVSYLTNSHQLALKTSDNPLLSLRMLVHGRIDLWATGLLSGPVLARQHGFDGLEVVYRFKVVEGYLAFHPSTLDELINTLNKNIELLYQEGVVDYIVARYLDGNSPL